MNLRIFILSVLILFHVQSNISYGNIEYNLVVSNTVNGLTISIDGRQELLSIVQYLGGYFNINKLKLNYKTDIDSYFSDFKQHEAVKFFQELTNQGFNFDAPPAAMLYFSDNFNVEDEFSEYIVNRAKGKENIYKFAKLMKSFAKDSKFKDFFISHRRLYYQIVNNISSSLIEFNEIPRIEQFYGMKQSSYTIILSILNSGNYGTKVDINGKADIYNIMSATNSEDGMPDFGGITNIEYLVWHEFSHSFVNYFTSENIELVNQYKSLYVPIEEQMERQGYNTWKTIVNESIIRAITVKLAEEKYGNNVAKDYKMKEIYRCFYYIEPLLIQLDNYIQNRDIFKTFSDFYPDLIKKAFDNSLTNIYQNINNTHKEIDFIVVSDDEKNDTVQREIVKYIKFLQERFSDSTPVITDKEALELDINNYSFIIYGTVKNNLLLQKFKNDLPVSISDTGIHADKEYNVINGKVIFNLPNPLNRDKFFLIYTAQKPEGIIGINKVSHGSTNYIVFEDRNKILRSGYILKIGGSWICI